VSFFKNVGVLTIGNVAAQAINFFGFIYLSRIYTPAEVGVYAVLIGASSIISVVLSCRYEMTILLPKTERSACLAIKSVLFVSFSFSVLLLFFLFLLSNFLDYLWLKNWAMVSLVSFFMAIININSYICTRGEFYKTIGAVQISRSILFFVFSILFFEFSDEINGLFFAAVFSGFIIACVLLFYQFKNIFELDGFNKKDFFKIKLWLWHYKDFLRFSTPAVFFSSAGNQMPIFMLSFFYGDHAAGYYSLLEKIVIKPIGIISGAVNKIYIRNVAAMIVNRDAVFCFSIRLIKKMAVFALVTAIGMAIMFFYRGLEFVFGIKWAGIDQYAIALIPVFMMGSLSKCIAGFAVLGKNKLGLSYQVILFISVAVSVFSSYYLGAELLHTFIALSATLTFAYSAQAVSILRIVASIDKRALR
jgi:O-antigen/teichoic acid export membrane protein